MPSSDRPPDQPTSRRRVLAGLGTALTGALAGCSGRLPGTGPVEVDTESTVEDDGITWEYPPREADREGIGYASVTVDRPVRRERLPPALGLECNSTVGGIASSDPYRGYRPDWVRFRIGPPPAYEGHDSFEVRVEPPGQWKGFSAYYERGARRRFVVELREVDTQGTILVPAVFDPGTNGLPERLHCSFAVQVSRPGAFGKTVRVADRGTLELDAG